MVRKLQARLSRLSGETDDAAEALYLRVFPDPAERVAHLEEERALEAGRPTPATTRHLTDEALMEEAFAELAASPEGEAALRALLGIEN
jgi:hypothetical protein